MSLWQSKSCAAPATQALNARSSANLCAQALQECQGHLKQVVQGIERMQGEIQDLRRRQPSKQADEQGTLLAALHSGR